MSDKIKCLDCVYFVEPDPDDFGNIHGPCWRFPMIEYRNGNDFCGEFHPGPLEEAIEQNLK